MTAFRQAVDEAVAKATAGVIREFSSRQYLFPNEMETWVFLKAIQCPNRFWARAKTAIEETSPLYETVGELRRGLLCGNLQMQTNFGKKSAEWLLDQVMKKA